MRCWPNGAELLPGLFELPKLPTKRRAQLFVAESGLVFYRLFRGGYPVACGEQQRFPFGLTGNVLHHGLCYVRG